MGAMLGVSRGHAGGNLPTTSETATASTSPSTTSTEEKQEQPEKSGNVLSVIEDLQRLPNEAIHQEFDRLLVHTGRHFKSRDPRPCEDVSEKLQYCLHQNHQRSCKCFTLMEQYRQCVYRATQEKLDMSSEEEEPPLLPITPPVIMPQPQMPVQQQRRRSRWKFWTWFR
ncbi:uncharacterized protein Dwil_GK16412 [Drosophila willistoni]|uniref:CHCH domain-containing protein n=1 Tax=Drosophila willistoni TaxID=7260 RepID=B4N221_DROWI|nr:uncharacterized protein Dwil_GK16412 [Drosophila willistoni]